MAIVLGAAASARAENAVTPGQFIVEPPTLVNLGFEWKIQGDDDRNATVAVEYRKRGDARWRPAQPLLRIGDEKVWRAREHMEYTTPRMFAGSILDLEEGATYECRFTMRDPGGVSGTAVQTATVTTRTVPRAYTGGRTLHVYPAGYKGPRQEPSYDGLMQAYYGSGLGDWDVVWERKARPGDVILVHAGTYRADRLNYVDPYAIPFFGTYVLTIKGTAEKPIVIRGAGDGEAIFDGDGSARLFDVMAADYNYFENLTIRNTDVAFWAGEKGVLGASGLVVRNCRLEQVGVGITTRWSGSKNFYIADNVIIGRDDQNRLIGWNFTDGYPPTQLKSYIGIKIYGQGHVIQNNYVAYFHDGIDVCTHGPPDEAMDQQAVAIDILNNDVFLMIDDFIEADGGVHNIRVARNRGFNAGEHALSVQPIFGGPAYFYRNVVYNVARGAGIKFGGAHPAGVVFQHNTFITENAEPAGGSNAHLRNNLFLGFDNPTRPVFQMWTHTAYTSVDYDGFRPNRNGKPQFVWRGPPREALTDFAIDREDGPWDSYGTLADFQRGTGQEKHGVIVDYDVFRNVRPPDPRNFHRVYTLGDMDFRLRPGGAAVDRGVPIANVNDGFSGRAPDLGALELGQPTPVYGPRLRGASIPAR